MKRTILIVLALVAAGGCAPRSARLGQECASADATLRRVLAELERAKMAGCDERSTRGAGSCVMREAEVDRLALMCQAHTPTLLAAAVIANGSGQTARAQQYLDQVLATPGIHPDAAVLRARLAIDEGNLPFARRFLSEQIALSPDHAELRETLGGALYLSKRLDEARMELLTAMALGAPAWRIAYHLGLIEEAGGHPDIAQTYYRDAIDKNPNWAPARGRLNAILALRRAH